MKHAGPSPVKTSTWCPEVLLVLFCTNKRTLVCFPDVARNGSLKRGSRVTTGSGVSVHRSSSPGGTHFRPRQVALNTARTPLVGGTPAPTHLDIAVGSASKFPAVNADVVGRAKPKQHPLSTPTSQRRSTRGPSSERMRELHAQSVQFRSRHRAREQTRSKKTTPRSATRKKQQTPGSSKREVKKPDSVSRPKRREYDYSAYEPLSDSVRERSAFAAAEAVAGIVLPTTAPTTKENTPPARKTAAPKSAKRSALRRQERATKHLLDLQKVRLSCLNGSPERTNVSLASTGTTREAAERTSTAPGAAT